MNVMLLKELPRNLIFPADRTDIADSCLCGLLHHVPELSGQQKFALARQNIHLDLQGIPARTRPRETAHNAGLISIIFPVRTVFFPAEISLQTAAGDFYLLFLSRTDLPGRFPGELCEPALQSPHAGLPGIAADDFFNRRIADRKLLRL